jgi:hypothetical protein
MLVFLRTCGFVLILKYDLIFLIFDHDRSIVTFGVSNLRFQDLVTYFECQSEEFDFLLNTTISSAIFRL